MANPKRVLILGGTIDATELATKAAAIPEVEVILSLAGRTRQPVVPCKTIRIGGFGGVAGLTDYLRAQQIDLLMDATHPFAAEISFNAAAAATTVGVPRLMLIRPAWEAVAADHWLSVASYEAAAIVLPSLAQRIFLTIGRQELAPFVDLQNLWFLMRMVDPPPPHTPMPPGQLLLERGPFSLEAERSRLQQYEIGAIVTKNSGGEATYAKIIAARELKMPIVMVQRPPVPMGESVADVKSAISWLLGRFR